MKPREKLLTYGPKSLSNQELLALILRSGNRRESIHQLSRRIIQESGIYSILTPNSVQECQDTFQLGRVHASQLIAATELARRLLQKNTKQINSLDTLSKLTREMRNFKKEVLRGIYVSTSLEIIADEIISIGTLDKNIAHPREILAPAIEARAYGFFLVHNHPSGNPNPSEADIKITAQIKQAADILQIEFFDHIIVAKKGVFSFHKNNILN